jgi:cytochrome c556
MFAMLVAIMAMAVSRAEDQDVIDYRQHVMKTIGEQTAIIDMILQKRIPAVNVAIHARVLAITVSTTKKAFEPRVWGGNSKPDVWAKWQDFSKRLDELAAASEDLAKAVKTEGAVRMVPNLKSSLKCESCHDEYMAVKK